MEKESEENHGASSSLNGLQPNCSTTTTSIQQQNSLPGFLNRNRIVVALPQTIPSTPPSSYKDPAIGGPGLLLDDDICSGPVSGRTQLLSVSQMVRQQSDTTNNRRLMRSSAICDDRPATSINTSIQVNSYRIKLHLKTTFLTRFKVCCTQIAANKTHKLALHIPPISQAE